MERTQAAYLESALCAKRRVDDKTQGASENRVVHTE
jgi:hypothetical protein